MWSLVLEQTGPPMSQQEPSRRLPLQGLLADEAWAGLLLIAAISLPCTPAPRRPLREQPFPDCRVPVSLPPGVDVPGSLVGRESHSLAMTSG
jgi:hypothetical protein